MSETQFKTDYPFTMDGRVEWGDMDCFGHVNNAFYFRYFERVRMELFMLEGLFDYQQQHNLGPILGSTSCKFILPLTYPDKLLFGAGVAGIQGDRFTLKQGIYSEKHDRLAAFGEGLIVYYDYGAGGKTEIPDKVREALDNYAVPESE